MFSSLLYCFINLCENSLKIRKGEWKAVNRRKANVDCAASKPFLKSRYNGSVSWILRMICSYLEHTDHSRTQSSITYIGYLQYSNNFLKWCKFNSADDLFYLEHRTTLVYNAQFVIKVVHNSSNFLEWCKSNSADNMFYLEHTDNSRTQNSITNIGCLLFK